MSTEIYKCINDLSPSYIKNIFCLSKGERSSTTKQFKHIKYTTNQTTKILRSLEPKIWNYLPTHIKCSENLQPFKNMMKVWDADKCTCCACNKRIL